MWTKEHRARQRVFERRRYPTALTDEEWAAIRPRLPKPAKRGRPPTTDLREVLNAICSMARSGCGGRLLAHEFGPWQTVYWWFRRFVRRCLFQTIHAIALMLDREQAGREASPSAGVLDSQTSKAPHAAGGGDYDAAKKVRGRKRHMAVDTDGRLRTVNLTTADVQDAAGAEAIIKAIRRRWPWLKPLFADGAGDYILGVAEAQAVSHERQAGDEIVTTDEMIRAGVEAYAEFFSELRSESADVAGAERKMVVSVYLAMTRYQDRSRKLR